MFGRQIISTVIILSVAVAAFGHQPQSAMKGYELYSWKVKGKWHYSLLSGTNRVKSFDEITTNRTIRVGDAALKSELKNLPKGEEVFWTAGRAASNNEARVGPKRRA